MFSYFLYEGVDAFCERVQLKVDMDKKDKRGNERTNEKNDPHDWGVLWLYRRINGTLSFTI
jgi:hypothetical protein